MLSKNKRLVVDGDLPAPKKWRACVRELVADNVLSGKRVQELINVSSGSGAEGVTDAVRIPLGC